MAGSGNTDEVKQLQLQISASTELLVRNLKSAEAAVAGFRSTNDRQLADVENRFDKMGGLIGSSLRASLGSVTGLLSGLSVLGAVSFGRNILNFADDLSAAADKAGVGVERFQTLREGMRALEVNSEQLDKILKTLTDTLGAVQSGTAGKAVVETLDRMGISAKIASGEIKSADQLLDAMGASVTKFGSSTQFTAGVVDILGRKLGVDLAAALRDGGVALHKAEDDMRSTGHVITEEMVNKLADANEVIDRFWSDLTQQTTIWAAATIEAAGRGMDKIHDLLALMDLVDKRELNISPTTQKRINNLDAIQAGFKVQQLEEQLASKLAAGGGGIDIATGKARATGAFNFATGKREPGTNFSSPMGWSGPSAEVESLRRQVAAARANLQRLQGQVNKDQWSDMHWGGATSVASIDAYLAPPSRGGGGDSAGGKAGGGSSRKTALTELDRALEEVMIHARNVGIELDKIEVTKSRDPAKDLYDRLGIDPDRELAAIRDKIDAQRKTVGEAADQAWEQWYQHGQDRIQTLSGELEDAFTGAGGNFWDQFKRFGISAVSEILARLATNNGGQGGGLGAIIGAVLGGNSGGGGGGSLGGVVGAVKAVFGGGSQGNPTGALSFGGFRAAGGPVDPSRYHIVGERGPELFVPRTAGTIIPNHRLGGSSVSVSMPISIDATGADPAGIARVQAQLDQMSRELPARVTAAVNDGIQRRTIRSPG